MAKEKKGKRFFSFSSSNPESPFEGHQLEKENKLFFALIYFYYFSPDRSFAMQYKTNFICTRSLNSPKTFVKKELVLQNQQL